MKYTCTLFDWLLDGPSIAFSRDIAEVHLTDCAPHKAGDSNYSWWDGKHKILTHSPCDLPHEIFELLKGYKGTGYTLLRSTHTTYPTLEAAVEDLSQALLTWARNQAKGAQL